MLNYIILALLLIASLMFFVITILPSKEVNYLKSVSLGLAYLLLIAVTIVSSSLFSSINFYAICIIISIVFIYMSQLEIFNGFASLFYALGMLMISIGICVTENNYSFFGLVIGVLVGLVAMVAYFRFSKNYAQVEGYTLLFGAIVPIVQSVYIALTISNILTGIVFAVGSVLSLVYSIIKLTQKASLEKVSKFCLILSIVLYICVIFL